MAAKTAQDDHKTKVTINARDAKALLSDFVYREDMDVSEVAQYLETDWDDAYNWLNDQLEAAGMDGDE